MEGKKRTYQSLGFEARRYSKAEMANKLMISPGTLRRELLSISTQLEQIAPYNKYQKLLYPIQIEYYLAHFGYIESEKSPKAQKATESLKIPPETPQ